MPDKRTLFWCVWGLLVLAVVALPFFAGGAPESGPEPKRRAPDTYVTRSHFGVQARFDLPGLSKPVIVAADAAGIPDDEKVVGVSVGGRHRAYRLKAFAAVHEGPMRDPTLEDLQVFRRHVVNDRIGTRPITVTHCDNSQCTRVLTDPDKGAAGALEVHVGGYTIGRQMLLRLHGTEYVQSSKEIPLDDVPFQMTTWGKWRAAHPETDLYTGE